MDFETKDVSKLDTLAFALSNYIAHSTPNGKLYKGTTSDFATFLAPFVTAVGASGYVSVSGNVLPDPVNSPAYTLVGAGTYTQTGEASITANGTLNIISWNGTTWTLVKEITIDVSDLEFAIQNIYDVFGKKTLINNSYFNENVNDWLNSGGVLSYENGNLKYNNSSNQFGAILGGFTTPTLADGSYIFEARIKVNIRSNGAMRLRVDNVDYPFTLINDLAYHTYKIPFTSTGDPTNFIIYSGSISAEQEILIDYAIIYDANQGVAGLEPMSKLDATSAKPVNSSAVYGGIGGLSVVENGDFNNGVDGWISNLSDAIEAHVDNGKNTLLWNADGRPGAGVIRTQNFILGDVVIEVNLKANIIGDGKIGVEVGGEKTFLNIRPESGYHSYLFFRKLTTLNNNLIIWNGDYSSAIQELELDYVKVYDYSALNGLIAQNTKDIENVKASTINDADPILPADINHIISYGQSLSLGATAPAITTTVFDPNMLLFVNSYDGTGGFIPFAFENGFAEIPVGGTAVGLHELALANGKNFNNSQFVFSYPGLGGASINDLKKGTDPYNKLLSHVVNGYNQATAIGKSYAVYSINWYQGEADKLNMTVSQYQTILTQLKNDLQADISAFLNNDFEIIWTTYQLSSFNDQFTPAPDYNKDFVTVYPKISKEVDNIYFTNPNYDKVYTDGVHLNAISYKRMGAESSLILYKLMTGLNVDRLDITSVSFKDKVINITFNKKVQSDTVNVNSIANLGFTMIGNVINSVSVKDNRVSLFCADNVFSDQIVNYGFNATGTSGKTNGPRGNIRATIENKFSFGSTFEWLAHSKILLT